MIILKVNSILTVAIFILSLRKINAMMHPAFEEVDVDSMRNICIKQLSDYFKDNVPLREYGKIAIDRFIRVAWAETSVSFQANTQWNFCTVFISEDQAPKVHPALGNMYAYYSSFKDHLLSGEIPDVYKFCEDFNGVIEEPETCAETLALTYTYNKHEALIKVFYDFRVGQLTKRLRSTIDGNGSIDLNWEYFKKIREKFELNTGPDGMRNKKDFCFERHHE